MNGGHDLGGMHGLGRILVEENDPTFHADWERRAFALLWATFGTGKYTGDEFRHGIERIHPADYLTSRYYEHWLHTIERNLVAKGISRMKRWRTRPGTTWNTPTLPFPAGMTRKLLRPWPSWHRRVLRHAMRWKRNPASQWATGWSPATGIPPDTPVWQGTFVASTAWSTGCTAPTFCRTRTPPVLASTLSTVTRSGSMHRSSGETRPNGTRRSISTCGRAIFSRHEGCPSQG
jgi:hypothetical protein